MNNLDHIDIYYPKLTVVSLEDCKANRALKVRYLEGWTEGQELFVLANKDIKKGELLTITFGESKKDSLGRIKREPKLL